MKAIAPNLKFCWNTNHGTMLGESSLEAATRSYDAGGGTAGTLYLDDASLSLSSGGANLIANPGFESGGANWIVESGAPFTIVQNP